ncbi:hypothetical protein QYE76_028210 [Lolium multiflorum]|uniref:CCHC-type domain-containing protein n=1 Tax=Lolium multiflorum TaxID=4521 RepID=A0AAD8QLB4_LOLMU|nr:hypothetical protein QYE76_028210 [Lolium multiflorum]
MEGGNPTPSGIPTLGRFPYHMEGFGFGSYSETCSTTLGASTYIMRGKGRAGHPNKHKVAAPPQVAGAPLSPNPSRPAPPHPARLAKLRRISPPPPTPRRRAVGFKRSYYFRCPLERGEMASPINFNQFLEKEKLKSNGSNFTDWFRHVRIFLSGGNLQFVLDAPLGDPPAETETDEVKNVYATRKTRYSQVQCAILCSLESDLQKRFEHHDPHELMNELKAIFETHAAVECYEASKHFFSCMMEEGSSISEHMLAMTGHAKKLSDLGIVIPNRLGINCVLQSLPPSYKNFVMNYNMQNMNKELPELFGMLKAAEIEIKKEHQVLMVNKTTSFKKQGKSKGKFKKGGKKAATPPMKPKNGPKPDAECYYCKEKGHWKHNCSKYLADLKSGLVKKKKEELEYGMEFKVLFEVPDEIPDITRSSGMVWRIRFIYRKSYSKFGNDPVHLWQVLEGSRKVRKNSTMEGGVPEGLH